MATNGTKAKPGEPGFEIPKMCKAGVVQDEGPNFWVKPTELPVPEISMCPPVRLRCLPANRHASCRAGRGLDQAQRYRYLPLRRTLHGERLGFADDVTLRHKMRGTRRLWCHCQGWRCRQEPEGGPACGLQGRLERRELLSVAY